MRSVKYQSFVEEQTRKENGLLQCLEVGSIPLLHIDNHKFRDEDKQKHREKTGGVYLRHFLTAKKRANLSQKDFKAGHLREEKFDENLPFKNHAAWLKVRDVSQEGPPTRFGKTWRTENERIRENLEAGDGHWIDHEAKDTKMIYLPDWKPISKNKWVGSKTIDTTTCLFTGPKSNPPWEEFPLRNPNEDYEYEDGFDKIGEQIHRFRDKSKEHGKPDFLGTVAEDMIGKKLHISQSIRQLQSHKALGIPLIDEFSKNGKLLFYKEALISTKSVDHQVPYIHSQSVRGQPMRDLMPVSDRIYKLSLKQQAGGYGHQLVSEAENKISEQIEALRPRSNQGSPSGEIPDRIATEAFQDAFKSKAKPSTSSTFRREPQQKISRGSMGSTNATWGFKPRASTATKSTHHATTSMQQYHRNTTRHQPTTTLNQKLEADRYYQPTGSETKDLVSKYFS